VTVLPALPLMATPIQPLDSSWLGALWFLAAIVLLDCFDISLPRGDSTGVAGALCAAGIIVLGPVAVIGVSLASAVLASFIRPRPDSPRQLVAGAITRTLALLVTSALIRVPPVHGSQAVLFAVIPAVFLATELLIAQGSAAMLTGRPMMRLIRGNADSQSALLAAQWSASVLLLITYGRMGRWSLIPVVALLLLMRQSYALFLDVRETYKATVEVLVEAAESQDDRRVGHAERTAVLARSVAMKIGLSAHEVERISYAALLHDLGELAEGVGDGRGVRRSSVPASDIVRGVAFFDQVEPILRVCEGDGYTGATESDLMAALIVALASDIDSEYHPQVAAAHEHSLLDQVAHRVAPSVKARAVGAALRLGYRIPAVS
jgi:hypothetical protein